MDLVLLLCFHLLFWFCCTNFKLILFSPQSCGFWFSCIAFGSAVVGFPNGFGLGFLLHIFCCCLFGLVVLHLQASMVNYMSLQSQVYGCMVQSKRVKCNLFNGMMY